MIKTIFLHIGVHKTASTTFQKIAYVNRETLKSKGYLFPEFRIGRAPINNHSIPLVSLFHPAPETYQINVLHGITGVESVANLHDAYREQLRAQLNQFDGHSLLLSGEGISTFDKEQVENLKTFLLGFTNKNVQFKVILFCRHPVAIVTSRIQECIKHGILSVDDAVKREMNKDAGYYLNIISTFSAVFGSENLTVLRFEDAVKHPAGPSAALLSTIGVDLTGIEFQDNHRFNRSMSYESVAIIGGINDRVPLIVDGKKNQERDALNEYSLRAIPGIKFKMSAKAQDEIWLHYYEDINRLCRLFSLPEYQYLIQQAAGAEAWSSETLREVEAVLAKQPEMFREMILEIINGEIENQDLQLSEEKKRSLQRFVDSNRTRRARLYFSSRIFLKKKYKRLKKLISLFG